MVQKWHRLCQFRNPYPGGRPRHIGLRGLNAADRDLAGAPIFLGVERNLLTLAKTAHTGAFQRSGVNKHVLAAAVGLDEAEALLIVIEFYSSGSHRIAFLLAQTDLVQPAYYAT